MPIYEHYCPDCHAVFSFFAATTGQRKKPNCPRCQRPKLDRRPSTFATLRQATSAGDGDGLDSASDAELDAFAGLDERRVEGALESLAVEAESLGDSDDPRAVGQLLRKFGSMTGLELGPKMEDALQRMEAGEDPESIDQDLGGDGSESLDELFRLKKSLQRQSRRPEVDDELHFL